MIIPRGSPDILNGCSGCGGKKFMYVSTPMDEKKRLEIKNQADKVRDQILSKADKRILEALERKGIGEIDGVKLTMEGPREKGWFRVTPPAEEASEPPKVKKKAREIIEEYDREMAASGRIVKEHVPKKAVEDKPEPIQFEREIERPKGIGPRKKKKAETVHETPPSDDINVIKIVEKGVYEIDVQKLLDDSPIIIERDGTYLIHLPSLLELKRSSKKDHSFRF